MEARAEAWPDGRPGPTHAGKADGARPTAKRLAIGETLARGGYSVAVEIIEDEQVEGPGTGLRALAIDLKRDSVQTMREIAPPRIDAQTSLPKLNGSERSFRRQLAGPNQQKQRREASATKERYHSKAST